MQDNLNNTYDLRIPSEIGESLKVISTRIKENFEKNCNTMHPIPRNCLNCKHEHCKEGYDCAYGMIYIYEHWCEIDRKLMNVWYGDKKSMPENCPYYEYGEPTIHHVSDEEKERLGI